MANYNKVILVGNLTRDPQLRYTPSQMAVCDFGLAVNRKFKGQGGDDREEVCFIDCTAWGKQAEIVSKYCQKGRPLLVEGRLKLDTWEDKQGGGKRSKHTVVVENFQLLGGRGDAPQEEAHSEEGYQAPQQRGGGSAQGPSPISDQPQFKKDDIPF